MQGKEFRQNYTRQMGCVLPHFYFLSSFFPSLPYLLYTVDVV